ncbi:MAG TPA: hypothetical protein VN682_09510 [Terriglobales bacterium]|nr:hypothetical protein [Terriglobales bacterium]
MKIRIAAIPLVLTCALAAQQQKSGPHPAENTQTAAAPQTKDLAANLARMRALVQRMQSNLPAVASGQSPLEHEFQLEIEMWQLLIDQMDQQLKAGSAPAH